MFEVPGCPTLLGKSLELSIWRVKECRLVQWLTGNFIQSLFCVSGFLECDMIDYDLWLITLVKVKCPVVFHESLDSIAASIWNISRALPGFLL